MGARYQNNLDTLVRVVGEKEAFCAVNVSCFPSKDLTFGLVGTDHVCERCVVSGRFFGWFCACSFFRGTFSSQKKCLFLAPWKISGMINI